MLRVNSTEIQNNFGKYLLLSQKEDIIITRNGQDVACLVNIQDAKARSGYVAEEVISGGYGLRKATYEEFLELTKDTEDRYEYIDGEIFLQASPKTDHQLVQTELFGAFYHTFSETDCTPFVAPYDITIRRSEDNINVVQPDLMVICDLEEKLGDDGYYKGVPVLVVEILSPTTRRLDLLKKLNLYMNGGVHEYWIVDPENKDITLFTFKNGDISDRFTFKAPEKARSVTFPHLVVDLVKVFRLV